jgi:hypothetical protein
MIVGDACCALDSATKFHNFCYISGWFHHEKHNLESVEISNCEVIDRIVTIKMVHGGVSRLGADKGFRLQLLMRNEAFPLDAELRFFAGGNTYVASVNDLISERLHADLSHLLSQEFSRRLQSMPHRPKLLDIGGRNRSRLDRSKLFPFADVTVLDIVPGDNVDVIGDAHELGAIFSAESFDAVLSVSVFEHLLMPWKVVLGINSVLKNGGIGLVSTHQTLGMHDEPWDFWRFSAHSWDALFNPLTGFLIDDRAQSLGSYILPMLYRPDKIDAEKAVGFESSAVLFHKIGLTELSWRVATADVISSCYPSSSG